ncbi:hypothetical protein ABTF26_20165, partial [Acinetobacter baumannii]
TADQLTAALPSGVDPHDSEVTLVAPAVQQSPLKFWVSDADGAIARAQQVSQASVEELEADGITAHGDTGEADPLQAIEDALATFPAD